MTLRASQRYLATLAALLAPALLVACGDDSGSGSSSSKTSSAYSPTTTPATTTQATTTAAGGGGSTLTLSADPGGQLRFDKSKLTAKAGTVTLTMDNPSSAGIPHAIAVEGNGVDKDGETVQAGGTSSVTVKLKPGTYEYYCPVPGHKAGGMKGTLTVG